MELFDLVNEQDQVVGVTNKTEAHEKRLPHRAVAVYVFNEQNELLVQVHKKSSGKYDHSVGGHVSKGEDYSSAASRESKEELGITQPLTHVTTFFSDKGIYHHMFGIFECIVIPSWQFVPNDEVEEIIPMSIEKIRTLMAEKPELFTGGFRNTMKEFCRVKGIS